MRLAYLTHRYPYPSHTFIRREIRELEKRGHEVFRCSLRSGHDAVVDAADRAEIALTFVVLEQSKRRIARDILHAFVTHPRRMLAAWLAAYAVAPADGRRLRHAFVYLFEAVVLARELALRGLPHLHVHFGTHPAAVAHVIQVFGGTPYSLTVHGPEEFVPEARDGLRLKVRAAVFTVAISDYCFEQVAALCDEADRSKLSVVRCGVDAAFLSGSPPIDPASQRLVCVGRLSGRKGQLRLLDAAARLSREGVAFDLVLVGDGELRGGIEARLDALDLRGCVSVHGWADESRVRSALLGSRGVVVPSQAEGLPVVIIEALALGRPVIASRVAAIPELVRDGETGWLVSPDAVDDLTDALRELLATSAPRLDEMAARGRALVLERHTIERQVGRLEALFQRALAT